MVVIVCGVGLAGALALRAFRENVMFYFDPSKVAAGQVKPGQRFRLGGMVVKGSVQRTGRAPSTCILWSRISRTRFRSPTRTCCPDLFKEGAGVVALGRMNGERRVCGRRSAGQAR